MANEELSYFLFEAYDSKRGVTVRGSWFARDEKRARFWLEQQGFVRVELRRSQRRRESVKVDSTALALFYRQLAVLMNAGVGLPFSLQLASFSHDRHLCGVARMLQAEVENGHYLSRAMRGFPAVFDSVAVGLITAAEGCGRLASTLIDLADSQEARQMLRSRLIASLTYPLVLSFFSFLGAVLFLLYVLPIDIELLGSMNRQPPAPFLWMERLLSLLSSPWLPLALLVLGSALGLLSRRLDGERLYEQSMTLLRRLPGVGPVVHKLQAVRLLSVLSLVICGGGTIDGAFKVMLDLRLDRVQRRAIEELRRALREGEDFGQALESSEAFPELARSLLRVGYETGRFEAMSRRAQALCLEDTQQALASLSALLEPLFLGLAGILAGAVVIISMLPMIELMQAL